MADPLQVSGVYDGRIKIRQGMESLLTPVERKKISKFDEVTSLVLEPDGSFIYKKTTRGRYEVVDGRIYFRPEEFNGTSLDSMQKAAELSGRAFGLAWLFEPFELILEGEKLVTVEPQSLVYTEYARKTR